MANNLPTKYKENIFTKIINRIKSILYKDNQGIEENNIDNSYIQYVNPSKEYRENSKLNLEELNKTKAYDKNSIEYALDQFNTSLAYDYQVKGAVNSYNALIHLSGMKNEDGEGNDKSEETLINALEQQEQFNIKKQKYENGETCFYHVSTDKYFKKEQSKDSENMRIYLNCKRKNVANIAAKLAQTFKDDSIYFKFSSDYQLSKGSRSEALVIYTDTEKIANIIDKLNIIHSNNKELFEGSENMNPFLKTVGGYISYAPEPKNDEYYKEDGKVEKVTPSYNSVLSKALQESFVRAAKETIARDKELTEKTQGIISDDINFYIKYFEDFKQGNYNQFINQMKNNLKEEAKRNKVLDIKGINDKNIQGGNRNEGR